MAFPYEPVVNLNVEELVVAPKNRFQNLQNMRCCKKANYFYYKYKFLPDWHVG